DCTLRVLCQLLVQKFTTPGFGGVFVQFVVTQLMGDDPRIQRTRAKDVIPVMVRVNDVAHGWSVDLFQRGSNPPRMKRSVSRVNRHGLSGGADDADGRLNFGSVGIMRK